MVFVQEPLISFRHAAIKIAWAEHLLGNLRRVISQYLQNKPYAITLTRDPGGQSNSFRVVATQPQPSEIACLSGDICHNLRASLDFCWMGVQRSLDANAGKQTLPIQSNVKGLETVLRRDFSGDLLLLIEDLLIKKVKSHHDFASGGNRLLIELNHLSNWQKHNLLVPALAVTELPMGLTITGSDGSKIVMTGPVRVHGAVNVAQVGGAHAQMSYVGEPTVEVCIDAKYLAGTQSAVDLLANFHRTAVEALKAFCDTWPSPHNPSFSLSPAARTFTIRVPPMTAPP